MAISDEDTLLVGKLYRAFNDGAPEMLDQVLSNDWQDLPMAPGQQPGRDGLKPLMTVLRSAFADLSFSPEEIIGETGKAAVRLSFSGRHVGEWMGVAATGKPFSIAWFEFHHIGGGRITHTWHLEDWSDWRRQIGVAPPSSA